MTQQPPTKATALSSIRAYTERLRKLHELFKPHPGQVTAGRAYFEQNAKQILLQCGRNFGKSLFGTYCAIRHAILNYNAAIYIIGPKQKQQSEIIWHSGYLRNMIPKEYLGRGNESFNQAQLRVWFDTGSFIKIDGSDNEDDLRGYKPDLLIIDEFKDWKREAFQAMEPNLKAKNASVIMVGTPPDAECFYTEMRRFVMAKQAGGDKKYFYLELPTSTNPHIDSELLAQTHYDMVQRGEEAVWEREYMARYVPGGAASVFPRFAVSTHVKAHDNIIKLIKRDLRKLQWFCVCDPGTTTVFAVLFGAINPYTGQVFLLDEIYEKDRALCSTTQIWERVGEIVDDLNPRPDLWVYAYDEAAAWFAVEVSDKYGAALLPTQKKLSNKDSQISLIRDLMRIPNKFVVSDRCSMFCHEVQNYITDSTGKLPRKNDHLIDCLRYLLSIANYELNPTPDPEVSLIEKDPGEFTLRTFAQDLADFKKQKDPFHSIDNVVDDELPGEDPEEWTLSLSDDL